MMGNIDKQKLDIWTMCPSKTRRTVPGDKLKIKTLASNGSTVGQTEDRNPGGPCSIPLFNPGKLRDASGNLRRFVTNRAESGR